MKLKSLVLIIIVITILALAMGYISLRDFPSKDSINFTKIKEKVNESDLLNEPLIEKLTNFDLLNPRIQIKNVSGTELASIDHEGSVSGKRYKSIDNTDYGIYGNSSDVVIGYISGL